MEKNESKHTPGQWEVSHTPGHLKPTYFVTVRIPNEDDIVIAKCKILRYNNPKEDAHLIAAAPELLEACKAMRNIINDSHGVSGYHRNGDLAEWDTFSDELTCLEQAIAKAEGKS